MRCRGGGSSAGLWVMAVMAMPKVTNALCKLGRGSSRPLRCLLDHGYLCLLFDALQQVTRDRLHSRNDLLRQCASLPYSTTTFPPNRLTRVGAITSHLEFLEPKKHPRAGFQSAEFLTRSNAFIQLANTTNATDLKVVTQRECSSTTNNQRTSIKSVRIQLFHCF